MRIQPADAERFVAAPPAALRAVLVYGPDAGLVRERAEALIAAVAGGSDDPFRVAPLAADGLDLPRLNDEVGALAMGGGRRAVRLRDAGDAVAGVLARFLDRPPPGDTLVVVAAGDLSPRSALRRLFESSDIAAALPCYAEEGAGRERLARLLLKEQGLAADDDTLAYLAEALPGDRAAIRSEIDKLALYVWPERTVTGDAARAAVGEATEASLDALAFAVVEGDLVALERDFARLMEDGTTAVGALRGVARHIQRLHLVAARVAAGRTPEQAVAELRPPVFWKVKGRIEAQARRARPAALAQALDALTQAECDAKTTGFPDRTLTHRALLRIAMTLRRAA